MSVICAYTGVYSLVDLEVLGPCEHFAAAGIRTRERLFASVHANVVDELVLGFERLVDALAVAPVARVVVLLGASDMVDRQVRYQLHH